MEATRDRQSGLLGPILLGAVALAVSTTGPQWVGGIATVLAAFLAGAAFPSRPVRAGLLTAFVPLSAAIIHVVRVEPFALVGLMPFVAAAGAGVAIAAASAGAALAPIDRSQG